MSDGFALPLLLTLGLESVNGLAFGQLLAVKLAASDESRFPPLAANFQLSGGTLTLSALSAALHVVAAHWLSGWRRQ